MKKILIDCGASNGAAIDDLMDIYGAFDLVYAIEPNPESLNCLREKKFPFEVVYLQNLVCSCDGVMKLFIGNDPTESSIFLEKRTGNLTSDNYIEVECLNFSKWLEQQFCDQSNRIVCKMDIEGAEFDVLEDIIRTSQYKKIDEFLVEWHVSRLNQPWLLRLRRFLIKLRIRLSGKRIIDWK